MNTDTSSTTATAAKPSFCSQCGTAITGDFCHQCGSPTQSASAGMPPNTQSPQAPVAAPTRSSKRKLPFLIAGAVVLLGGGAATWFALGFHAKSGLSAPASGNSPSAQSNLQNAVTAEQTYWTNNQVFSYTPADMAPIEASLNWVTGSTVAVGNNVLITKDPITSGVILTAAGSDGHCYSVDAINLSSGNIDLYLDGGPGSVHHGTCPAPPVPQSAPPQGSTASGSPGTWALSW
jgi:hypothetical protein